MSPHRADWLHTGLYGMMVHYLLAPAGTTDPERTADLERTVSRFDLDAFLDQFVASRADWLIFTLGQNTGYCNSPNAVLDKLLPGRTPRRDLVLDRYLAFVRAYSEKFGRLHHGWWFDGCYEHLHKNRWNWQNWLGAARAGNADAVVAFNDGAFCVGKIKPLTPLEDYHAREIHLLERGQIRTDFVGPGAHVTPDGRLRDKAPSFYIPDSRLIDGVQWHALLPLDCTFNPHVPNQSYSDAVLFEWVRRCKAVGGAVTLNVPIDTATGVVPKKSAAQLARLGRFLQTAEFAPTAI